MTNFPRLVDISEINPKLANASNFSTETTTSFVPMAAVSEATGSIVIEVERPFKEVSKGFTYFQNDDVLVAKITPCFENGKIAHAKIKNTLGFGSTEFHVVRANSKLLDSRYLYHFLRQDRIRIEGERKMTGSAGQRRVPKNFIENLTIPLPPLPEQRRIAEILDRADALREKRRKSIAMLDTLVQSVFLEMFGDPVTNPKGFSKIPLGELIKVKSGEFLPEKSFGKNGTFPVYGGNGISGYHNQYMFETSMIVIGRVGYYCGAVHVTTPKAWITDNALYVVEKSDKLTDTYLADALIHIKLNQYAGKSAQPLISGGRIYPIPILVPPIELQDKYRTLLQAVESFRLKAIEAESKTSEMFCSLQQCAFTGELHLSKAVMSNHLDH